MARIFNYAMGTEIVYGIGASKDTGKYAKDLGISRALIVTDPGIEKVGLLEGILASLKEAGVEVTIFAEVEENPLDTTIERAYELYAEKGCDGVIGVGGGSSMDSAKAVALLATNPGPLMRYEGFAKAENKAGTVICIPTTAGTGSEVTTTSVITDSKRDQKTVVSGPQLTATLALCDPELTVSLPPFLTATTGMDALSHALECYVNTNTNPISMALAYRAMELIGKNLRAAVANGQNLAARDGMLMGSLLAGMAFNVTRLGLAHSAAMPLGSWENKLPHGLANAIMLPRVTEFNLMADYERFAEVAKALGEDIEGLPLREAAFLAVKALDDLVADIGIPARLGDAGIKRENIPAIAEETMKSRNTLVNPRQATLQEVIELLERSM